MDPLSALGLAANIIQCVQFIGQVVLRAQDIHRSARGAEKESTALENAIEHLSSINLELASQSRTADYTQNRLSPAEMRLQDLLQDMRKVNSDVLRVLRDLEPQNGSVWGSIQLGFKSVWGEGKMKELENKLDDIRKRLDTTLLICIR